MSDATQAKRRARYGLNVTIALVAATGIVVGLNAIVDRQFRRLPPAGKDWVRFDLTATRQYSLSPQTRKVLTSLDEDYEIVCLFRAPTLQTQRVRDLVEEYPRYSSRLTVEVIDPVRDITAVEEFLGRVRERYADQIEPTEVAIRQGLAALAQTREAFIEATTLMRDALDGDALDDSATRRLMEQAFGAMTQLGSDLSEMDKQVNAALESPLPDYRLEAAKLTSVMTQLTTGVFPPVVRQFKQLVELEQTPADVKDTLLKVVALIEPLEQSVGEAQFALESVGPIEGYQEATATLLREECVAVLSPTQVRAIPVRELFREPDPRLVEQQGQADLGFIGEERLTGTLVSLSLKTPPLVVFVTNSQPAMGPRGAYRAVAQRLMATNFEVQQWNPRGETSPFGQPMPPTDPPQPKEGQKAVWVILPFPPLDPGNPMAAINSPKQEIGELLNRVLESGDAALVMLGAEPAAQFGAPDPIVQLVERWGVKPQLDRIVMRQIQTPDRQSRATAQFQVADWPGVLPITRALAGMPGYFVGPSPIDVGAADGVTIEPLVVLSGPLMWTFSDFTSVEAVQRAQYNPETAEDHFTIGVAAVKGDARLVAVADAAWATDSLVTYGVFGPGSAEVVGATFPGNGELFVNSVYWLAGLEELIAASPRSQDIRRIQAMSGATLLTYRWLLLAGMPLVILVAGTGVWLVRRKG